jgi:hypothetical protein
LPIPAGTLATLRAGFGGTIADWVASSAGGAIRFGSATLTFWDAPVGGNRHTDLMLGASSVDTIHVGIDGKIPIFQGPPGVTSMWVDAGQDRVLMNSADYAADYAAAAGESAAQAQVAAAAAVAVGATNDTIVAGLLSGASASRTAGDARWMTQTAGDARWATQAAGDARWVAIANRPINLKDVAGLDWTGATDSYTALQAALTAAGNGRRIEIGRPGILRSDTGLTLTLFQALKGTGKYMGAGGSPLTVLDFPALSGSAAGITGGGGNEIEDLIIRGPMTGAGNTIGFNSPSGSPLFRGVSFYGWFIGSQLTDAYYSRFEGCEWMYNRYGLNNIGCYNLELINPKIYAKYGASLASFGIGINGAARGMSVRDGAIEGYGPGGAISMADMQVLNVDGTYFESSDSGSGAFGIVAAALDKIVINLRGATAYLNEHSRFVALSGATNAVIHAEGNKYVCPTTSGTTPTAYYFNTSDVGNIKGHLGRDDWSEVLKSGSVYVQNAIFNLGQLTDLDIRHPSRQYLGGDIAGTGSPEGVVPGRVGAVYRRLDGGASTSLYVKESGSSTTGWVAK